MNPTLSEWLNLLIRWAHVIAGIMWIGDSLLFMRLDKQLTLPKDSDERLQGELWMVHSGGFYHLRKQFLAPHQLPPVLHWFRWEATTTWATGFCLLWVVYYLGGILVEPSSDITESVGIAIGLGSFIVAWLLYDTISRAKLSPFVVNTLLVVLFVLASYLLSKVFTGRAAFLHAGALLGTLMVTNVWLRILPAQWQLVASTKAGEKQDPALGTRAKLRSRHNNYMTYPVVLTMISNHFPTMYGHELNWLVLCLFFGLGASVRHAINLGKTAGVATYLTILGSALGLLYLTTWFE